MVAEIGDQLYDIIGVLGYLIIIFFSFMPRNLKRKEEFTGTLFSYLHRFNSITNKQSKQANYRYWVKKENLLFFFIQIFSFTFSGEFFGSLLDKRTDAYGFLFITPIIMYFVCYLIGTNPLKQVDTLTLSSSLIVSFLKIACFCAGCCPGLETSFGLYNYDTGKTEFPIQLVEGAVYFIIFIAILFSKKLLNKDGVQFPIFVIMYSLAKFVLQFFRSDEKIISIFNIHHFTSIVAFVIGLIYLILVYRYGETIVRKFNREIKLKSVEKRLNKYFSLARHKDTKH